LAAFAGLITIGVLERIVGEIEDEFDIEEDVGIYLCPDEFHHRVRWRHGG
jgi:Mg2+/Co2+ transporter CorC